MKTIIIILVAVFALTGSVGISYSIPKSEHISLKVYDISGKCIRILEDGNKNAGMHCVTWDGLDNLQKRIPTGIYFVQLISNEFIPCRKILVIK